MTEIISKTEQLIIFSSETHYVCSWWFEATPRFINFYRNFSPRCNDFYMTCSLNNKASGHIKFHLLSLRWNKSVLT